MILLVDDDASILEIFADYFETIHLQSVSASSGQEAFQKLSSSNLYFQYIISDLEMPNGNGIWLAEKIRDSAHLKHLPIFLHTGKSKMDIPLEQQKLFTTIISKGLAVSAVMKIISTNLPG